MLLNRLKKNLKERKKLFKNSNIDAFRLYDRDIPEFPFTIDCYGDYFIVWHSASKKHDDSDKFPVLIQALLDLGAKDRNHIIIKTRAIQKGLDQYQRLGDKSLELEVQQHQAKFITNLSDYLDTGLFLDHRPMRQEVFNLISSSAQNLPAQPTFLNLFAYTGSVSVFAVPSFICFV